jgi:hypothetical protein
MVYKSYFDIAILSAYGYDISQAWIGFAIMAMTLDAPHPQNPFMRRTQWGSLPDVQARTRRV